MKLLFWFNRKFRWNFLLNKKALRVGLTEKQMKRAMKSSAITSNGSSIVILSGMLSLVITVGGPMAWMRLSLIGSVMFESIACVLGAMIMGVLSTISEKKNIKWLKEWNLTISILASLVITALI